MWARKLVCVVVACVALSGVHTAVEATAADALNELASSLAEQAQSLAPQIVEAVGAAGAPFFGEPSVSVTIEPNSECVFDPYLETMLDTSGGALQKFVGLVQDQNDPSGIGNIALKESSGAFFEGLSGISREGSAGIGLGWGLTVSCGSTVIFSYGAGGGGGGNGGSQGYGGGGGGQAGSDDWGGGGGCSSGNACSGSADPGSKSHLSDLHDAVKDKYKQCGDHPLQVCVEGGGGGGASASHCKWGGGLSFTWRTAGASCSNSNQGGQETGVAARICSIKCEVTGNFNSCFCPCFKNLITAAGLSWGSAISCSTMADSVSGPSLRATNATSRA